MHAKKILNSPSGTFCIRTHDNYGIMLIQLKGCNIGTRFSSKKWINFALSTLPLTMDNHLMSNAPMMPIAFIQGAYPKYLLIGALVPIKLYSHLVTYNYPAKIKETKLDLIGQWQQSIYSIFKRLNDMYSQLLCHWEIFCLNCSALLSRNWKKYFD